MTSAAVHTFLPVEVRELAGNLGVKDAQEVGCNKVGCLRAGVPIANHVHHCTSRGRDVERVDHKHILEWVKATGTHSTCLA